MNKEITEYYNKVAKTLGVISDSETLNKNASAEASERVQDIADRALLSALLGE